MHLEGEFTVTAARPEAYAFLTDPARIGRHMPDVRDVVVEDADHFTVTARVGVSHIKGTMTMRLEIRDRQPPVGTTVVGRGSGLAPFPSKRNKLQASDTELPSHGGPACRPRLEWHPPLPCFRNPGHATGKSRRTR